MTWSSSSCRRSAPRSQPGEPLGEVESTKSVSEIYAPVAGTVVAVNADLAECARAAQQDPYGEGWICEIELADADCGRRPAGRRRLPPADRVLSGRPAGSRVAGSGGQGNALGGTATVMGVFCHNCGHRNPPGVNFCSSCGAALPSTSSETTMTLQPVDDHGETAEEEPSVTLVEVPHGTGCPGGQAGPERGARYMLERPGDECRPAPRERHLPRRHHGVAAARRDPAAPDGKVEHPGRRVAQRDVREPRADREQQVLSGGDEVQIGKFKLVYLVAGDE